jgi:hypothetical protein
MWGPWRFRTSPSEAWRLRRPHSDLYSVAVEETTLLYRLNRARGRCRRRPAPLLDARGYRGDLGIRVGPCIFGVWDQPIDRPTLDLVGRPRSLISGRLSRAGARTRRGSIMKVGDTSQKGTGPEEVLCPPARQSPATAPDTCKPAGQPIRRRCAPPVPSLRPLPLQRHPPPGPVRALSRLCRTAERRGASAASTGAARGRHRLART